MVWFSVSTAKYDTFISYSREDRAAADILAGRLRGAGLTVWLDRDSLVSGNPFPAQIEKGLEESASCCILVGRGGLTQWQEMERQVAAVLSVNSGHAYRVIAVILPDVGPETRATLPKFLAATTWVEFAGSMEDKEALRQLVCGIRGIPPGPPPFDPVPSARARPPTGAAAHDLSWAHSALPADAAVRFLFGTLQSPPPNRPTLCHYLVALIEKYSGAYTPAVTPAELRYVAEARQVLAQNGWPNAAPAKPAAVPEEILHVLVNAGGELPESFPTPDFWVGTSLPSTPQGGTRFYLCDVNLALVCILLHCADESSRPGELRGDLLYLPGDLRDEVRMLVGWLWPEVLAPSYEYLELPRVRDAFRTALKIIFPAGRGERASFEPAARPALAQLLDALRRRDFPTASELRKGLGEGDLSDASTLAYIDASLAIAEGDDATAELVLRETLERTADAEAGCNLALLLCRQGRYQEASDVLRRLESAAPSAADSPLFKTLNLWASHHEAPEGAVEDLAAELAESGEGSARLWHILSAACLDMGLVDAAIEYAKKATHLAPRALEYRVQHAAALLHRFPPTPPDYQRREPFPVRDREPREASYILENVLDGCARQDDRLVRIVHHLLGIAHYCAAVANRKQSERLMLFLRAAEQFSAAHASGGAESYRLAGYAGQSYLRAREFSKACEVFESIPPEGRSKSCENAFIVALAMDDRVDDAIAEVTRALERGGLPAEAMANVGTLVLQCGLPEDAKRLLRLAVTGLERPSWVVHFLLGRAHTDLREFAEAEQELWASISLNSTEPRLYLAHLSAFEQHTAPRARALLAEARLRVEGVRADTDFLDEFEQRVERTLEEYRRLVKGLNVNNTSGSTVVAKSFEQVRRAVDGLRVAVSSIGKLLRDPEARDAEVFLATARMRLGVAQGRRHEPHEPHAPAPATTVGASWVEFQRALSRDSAWLKAGLRLNDSGADVLAHVADAPQQPFTAHWLHLVARQFDAEPYGRSLRAYAGTQGVERKPYQEAVVLRAKVRNYGRILLADEVGLGKTIEACLIFSEYRERGLVKTCLILVPSRELGQQWERELTEKFGLRSKSTAELGRYRAPGWSGFDGHDVCVLTYQAALANAGPLTARRWDMVICDEAHHLTNRGSGRFKLLKALSKKAPYLLLLTATPIQRRVDDLFSLARLVRPSMFPTLKGFRERYCDPRNPREILRSDELAHRMLEIMARNSAGAVSSEVLLGRRRFNDLNVSLGPEEREFYDGVEALVFKAYKHGESGQPPLAYYSLARAASSSPMAAANWLESLAGEPSVAAEAVRLLEFARRLRPASKLRELKSLLSLASERERFIVFTDYRSTARCVADAVGGILIDSSLTDRQLGERLEAFRSGGGRILVATPRLSEGLNLQFCRNVVNFDLPWNPFKIEQRIGRVHRIGQRAPEVVISTLSASDTIEQLIKEFLQIKLRAFEGIVGHLSHQIFEFESRGTIEEQIREILARVENRKQFMRELEQAVLPHDPHLNRPPKSAGLALQFERALRRITKPDDDEDDDD